MNANLLTPSIHSLANLVCAALIASIWQGVLLVAGVALYLRLVPGLRASTRAAIWTGLLGFVVLLPLVALAPSSVGHASGNGYRIAEGWSVALLAAWTMLSAFRAHGLLRSLLHLRRLSQTAEPTEPGAAVAAILAEGQRSVQLCTSRLVKRPCFAGFFNPRIIVPTNLIDTLTAPELEQVVRHEMEHLRRRDDWTNLAQQVCLILCPLNPMVAWLDRRLAIERELACDDAVLQATGAPKAYAACLARIAEYALVQRGISLALAFVGRRGRKPEISRRVERILAVPTRTASPLHRRLAMGALFAAGALSVGLLSAIPQLISFGPARTAPSADIASSPIYAAAYRESLPPTRAVKMILPAALNTNATPMPRLLRTRAAAGHRARRLSPRQVSDTHMIVMTQWTVPTRPLRQIMTSFQVSPDSYAAIRFADGWLLVQL
jgi:hypothetical protein